MAINKRKVLDGARKLAQKGAKEKALKEYNKLVQADPRDTKLLLEIGDVYRRWGQAEEAIAQYTRVANQYKQDGFDARAVAVLKQILNLDPKRYASHITLAELYQRMGLDSEAIGALQTAADGYYREGRRREALELLRKMAALDPSNTTSRLKVADLLRQEGLEEDAIAEYAEVAVELKRQGAGENICAVQERILEMRPDHVPTLVALARNLSDLGRPERAERFAVHALELAKEPDHFELLAGLYKSLGNDVRLGEVTRELASYYKKRGDEDRAREVLQRLPADAVLPNAGLEIGEDRSDLDHSDLGDDELLEDEDFLISDASDQSELMDLEEAEPPSNADAAQTETAEADLPDGDPEQLLAEASVYLRYGKRGQAIDSLRSALRQQPAHRGALEKLGEAYAEEGQEDDAIGCWQRAAELARGAGDRDAFEILRDRISAIDPVAADEIAPMDAADDAGDESGSAFDPELSAADGAADRAADIDDGLDLSIDVSDVDGSDPQDDLRSVSLDADAGDDSLGLELDLDPSPGGQSDDSGPVLESGQDSISIDLDAGIEVEVDLDDDARDLFGTDGDGAEVDSAGVDVDLELAGEEPASAAKTSRGATPSASSQFGQSSTTAAQITEDLEEADFYIEQGLASEAEAIYRRILAVAPNHPTALLKLGELAAQRGDDPADVSEMGAAGPGGGADEDALGGSVDLSFDDATGDAGIDLGVDGQGDTTDEVEFDFDLDTDGAADLAAEAEDLSGELTEREVATGDAGSLDAGAVFGEDATEVEQPSAPGKGAAEPKFAKEPVQAEPDPDEALIDDTMPLSDAGGSAGATGRSDDSQTGRRSSDETFDLAAELADVFEDDEPDAAGASAAARSTVEDGFESLFSDFKKGVSATLDEGDYDTRFDLGIAYREMGLFDDALSEFTVCLGCPERKLECLHMMALCAMELDRSRDAINHIEQALSSGDLPGGQGVALRFDLGRVHRRAGDVAAARDAFALVEQADPGFPGLADELAALERAGTAGEGELELDTAEPYESFDDILGDDASETADPGEPETFESFDDVITEAEAGDPIADSGPELEPEPEVAPEATTDPGASRSGRRKKKISFV